MASTVSQAVVLAGGMGTRLRPLTNNRPKPLLPVLGEPCVEYVLRSLASAGVDQVILTAGYRAEDMVNKIGSGRQLGINMEYNIERTPAGTAGAVKLLESKLHGTFVVASGDVLADVDLNSLVKRHKETGAVATMALTEVEKPEEFGIVGLNEEGRIVRFKEKPKTEEVFSHLVNAGIYVIEPEVLPLIPEGQMFDFSKNLFPKLMEKGMPIYGFTLSGLWKDIGRPSDLLEANIQMAERRGKEISLPGVAIKGKIVVESFEGRGALLEGPLYVGEGPIVGRNSHLSRCAVGRRVRLGEEVTVHNSLIMEGSYVSKGAVIEDSLVGQGCVIGPGVAVIGSTFGDGVRVEGPSSIEDQTLE